MPTALTTLRTIGASRCRGGSGVSFRRAHTVSPSTERDAQLSSESGAGNTRGFISVQMRTTPTGTSDHQPFGP